MILRFCRIFGVLGFWGFGVLGFWGFGVLGFWSFGVLGFWGFGVLGVLGFWGFGVLGFWGFGVLGFWDFEFWGFGFGFRELSKPQNPKFDQNFKIFLIKPQNPKTPKPQNPKTPKPQNLKTPKPQNPKTPKPQNPKTQNPQNPKIPKNPKPKIPKPQNSIFDSIASVYISNIASALQIPARSSSTVLVVSPAALLNSNSASSTLNVNSFFYLAAIEAIANMQYLIREDSNHNLQIMTIDIGQAKIHSSS